MEKDTQPPVVADVEPPVVLFSEADCHPTRVIAIYSPTFVDVLRLGVSVEEFPRERLVPLVPLETVAEEAPLLRVESERGRGWSVSDEAMEPPYRLRRATSRASLTMACLAVA